MSLLLTLAGLLCAGSSDTIEVDDFACLDQNGTFQRLSRHADAQLVVLYVYANDCPIVRHNAGELQAVAKAFEPRGVRFLGLDPAPQDERKQGEPARIDRAAEQAVDAGFDLMEGLLEGLSQPPRRSPADPLETLGERHR